MPYAIMCFNLCKRVIRTTVLYACWRWGRVSMANPFVLKWNDHQRARRFPSDMLQGSEIRFKHLGTGLDWFFLPSVRTCNCISNAFCLSKVWTSSGSLFCGCAILLVRRPSGQSGSHDIWAVGFVCDLNGAQWCTCPKRAVHSPERAIPDWVCGCPDRTERILLFCFCLCGRQPPMSGSERNSVHQSFLLHFPRNKVAVVSTAKFKKITASLGKH